MDFFIFVLMIIPIFVSLLYAKRPNVDQHVNFVKIVGLAGIAGLLIHGVCQAFCTLFW